MTYWDRLGNFISTQRLDVANGKYFYKYTNANDVSFHSTNHNLKLRLKIGKTYALDAEIKHSQEINGDETIEFDIHYTHNNAVFTRSTGLKYVVG